MTSEIRANTLKNRVGLGTVSFTNTGPVVSGIVTANSFSATGDLDIDGHTNLDNLNVVGVSTFNGDINIDDGAADSAAGPELKLNRGSASPANADYLGQIKFAGRSSTGAERNYAKITGKILDVTNGSEDGILEFAHIKAGSQTITGRWRSDSLQLLNGTSLTVAGTSTFNGDITGAAGVDLNLDSTIGNNSTTAFSNFDGRLVFDTSFSDTARGPNKIQLQNTGGWVGGFGISANTLDIYTGGTTRFVRSTNTNTYTTQMSLDYLGNLSPSGDVRLTSSAGGNSSTAVTDAAWSRLEFDTDYSDSARGPNKIVLQHDGSWFGGFGISQNSMDVYTGGILHFYGKTNTADAANIETMAKFTTDGACELYHNNVKQFETTSAGAKVNGEFLIEGDTKRLFLRDTRGTGNTARPGIWFEDSAASKQFFIGNGSSTDTHLEIRNITTGDLIFKTNNNNERLRINSSGHVSLGGSNVTDVNMMTLNGSGASQNVGIVFNKTNSPARAYGINVNNTSGDLIFFDYTANSERVRITSEGYLHLGNSGHGTNKVGGQAITGQDLDAVVKLYSSNSNLWLAQLRADNTTTSGVFMRAGNSSSNYTLYATGYDENNPHLIVRGDGAVLIGESSQSGMQRGDVIVHASIQSGNVNEPSVIHRNSTGAIIYFEHYFYCNKGGAGNSHTVNQDIIQIQNIGNFHQAVFHCWMGVRLQGQGDNYTRPATWQTGVNRFNGGSTIQKEENWISADSAVQTYANLHIGNANSTSYYLRMNWPAGTYGSSFAGGKITASFLGCDVANSNITFAYGRT